MFRRMNLSILGEFRNLKVWQRGDEQAPHKPLLLLLALGRYVAGSNRLIKYSEIDKPLKELLELFGPPRKSFHSEYPFWRLRNDGIWELENAEGLETRVGQTDAKKSELIGARSFGRVDDRPVYGNTK